MCESYLGYSWRHLADNMDTKLIPCIYWISDTWNDQKPDLLVRREPTNWLLFPEQINGCTICSISLWRKFEPLWGALAK